MKVNGKILSGPRLVRVYLPISDDGAVEFVFRALRVDERFTDVCPRPVAPLVAKPGGVQFHDVEDAGYKTAIDSWADKKFDWEFLKSISATDGLEWSTVKDGEPETWKLWKNEIEEAFGVNGKDFLLKSFIDAQYITEETVERARESFLTGRQER